METIKCVVVGDGAVGKTSLLVCYTTNKFPSDYVPTVFDNYTGTVQYKGEPFTLGLFDTAGQEDYNRVRPLAYPQTDVILVCYSIANPSSFENITHQWIREINQYAKGVPFLLVGLQTDLRDDRAMIEKLSKNGKRPISYERGENLGKKHGAVKYIECSALKQTGVVDVFNEAVKAARDPPPKKTKSKCVIL